ncbi:Protein kinase-like domain superfamily protein [Pleurotus pulmonarius]
MGSFSRRRKWRTTMADISPHVKILDDVKENASSEVQTLRGVYEDPTTNATIQISLEGYSLQGLPEVDRILSRLKRQMAVHAALSHPNISPAFGLCVSNGMFLIAYPCYKNGDVSVYMAANPELPRFNLVLEIASALEYMHEQGVVHGSLNPSSILIADDGRPVIGNLSRAKILGRLGLTTHFTTDRYHAPETWMSKDTGGLTKESDVFSFGLVALFIISGRVPSWNTPATAPIKIDATKYPRIPVQVWDVIEPCWLYDATARPSISEVLFHLQSLRLLHATPDQNPAD